MKAERCRGSRPSSSAGGGHRGLTIPRLVVTSIFTLALGCSRPAEVEQPIAYEHKLHVAEEEIPCTECHIGAEDAEHATIPVGEVCRDCHEDPIGESVAEARLVKMLATGKPIPWKRVHKLREHVHFSHRRHVVAGRVQCERCHGDVSKREDPFVRPFITFNRLSGMRRCIACHIESGNPRANVDCALCHR